MRVSLKWIDSILHSYLQKSAAADTRSSTFRLESACSVWVGSVSVSITFFLAGRLLNGALAPLQQNRKRKNSVFQRQSLKFMPFWTYPSLEGCGEVGISIHLTVRILSSQSDTLSRGLSNVILVTLQLIGFSFKVLGWSDLKVTVMSLALLGWRWPTCGENLSCGWSGHANLRQSVFEWFLMEKDRVLGSLMKQSPNLIKFGLAAKKRVYKVLSAV